MHICGKSANFASENKGERDAPHDSAPGAKLKKTMETKSMYLVQRFEIDNPMVKHDPMFIIKDAATAQSAVNQLIKEEYKRAADEGRAVFYGYYKTPVTDTTELWKR